jgi:hypothetical protein
MLLIVLESIEREIVLFNPGLRPWGGFIQALAICGTCIFYTLEALDYSGEH